MSGLFSMSTLLPELMANQLSGPIANGASTLKQGLAEKRRIRSLVDFYTEKI